MNCRAAFSVGTAEVRPTMVDATRARLRKETMIEEDGRKVTIFFSSFVSCGRSSSG
jgi:hypothetical protein